MQSSSPLLFLMWTGCPACIMIALVPKLPPQSVHAQIFSLNLLRTPGLSAPRILLLDWIMKTHIWHVCPRLGWENLKETPRCPGKKLKKKDCNPRCSHQLISRLSQPATWARWPSRRLHHSIWVQALRALERFEVPKPWPKSCQRNWGLHQQL